MSKKNKNKKEQEPEIEENIEDSENFPEPNISFEKTKIVVDSNSSYLQYLLLIELKKISRKLELLEKIIKK